MPLTRSHSNWLDTLHLCCSQLWRDNSPHPCVQLGGLSALSNSNLNQSPFSVIIEFILISNTSSTLNSHIIIWPLVVPVKMYFSVSLMSIVEIWQLGGLLSHSTNGNINEPLEDEGIFIWLFLFAVAILNLFQSLTLNTKTI